MINGNTHFNNSQLENRNDIEYRQAPNQMQ